MQRVGIDLRITHYAHTGFHRYARGIIDSIRRFPQPDLRFVLLRHMDDPAPADGTIESVALATPLFCADEGERLRRETAPLALDIIHFPFSLFPGRIAPRVIVTIHDLTCVRLPDSIEPQYLPFYVDSLHRAVEAERVVAVSDQVVADLVARGLAADKVRRCYPLTPFEGGAFYEAGAVDHELMKDLAPHPFLLTIGSIEPRKNHLATLAAFAVARRRTAERFRLVVVGRHGWLSETFFRALATHPYHDDVCVVRDAGDATLLRLLQDCRLFLSSSSYEGFGLPVLEALAAGACVLSSPTPSLTESGFPGAAILDADHPEAVADRIVALLADPIARATLAAAGRTAVSAFYRSGDASRLAQVYRL